MAAETRKTDMTTKESQASCKTIAKFLDFALDKKYKGQNNFFK